MKPARPSKPGTLALTCTSAFGISFGPADSKAPFALSVFFLPPNAKVSLASKLALLSAFGLNAALSTWVGPWVAVGCADWAGWACAGSADLEAAGVPSLWLRAFPTAKIVAPRSATPRRARRKGREIAIASHIGRRPPSV